MVGNLAALHHVTYTIKSATSYKKIYFMTERRRSLVILV